MKYSASGELRSRIVLFLLRKHKFQVDLMVGIVLVEYAEICTPGKEILKVFALLDNLIYRIFQLRFLR